MSAFSGPVVGYRVRHNGREGEVVAVEFSPNGWRFLVVEDDCSFVSFPATECTLVRPEGHPYRG